MASTAAAITARRPSLASHDEQIQTLARERPPLSKICVPSYSPCGCRQVDFKNRLVAFCMWADAASPATCSQPPTRFSWLLNSYMQLRHGKPPALYHHALLLSSLALAQGLHFPLWNSSLPDGRALLPGERGGANYEEPGLGSSTYDCM